MNGFSSLLDRTPQILDNIAVIEKQFQTAPKLGQWSGEF